MGTPNDENWPGCMHLPDFIEFKAQPAINLTETLFTAASPDAVEMLSRMLMLGPSNRITAVEALRHPYFSNNPPPSLPSSLSLPLPEERKGRERYLSVITQYLVSVPVSVNS